MVECIEVNVTHLVNWKDCLFTVWVPSDAHFTRVHVIIIILVADGSRADDNAEFHTASLVHRVDLVLVKVCVDVLSRDLCASLGASHRSIAS